MRKRQNRTKMFAGSQGRAQPAEEIGRLLRGQQRVDHKGHHRKPRDQKDRVVNVQTEGADLRYDIVLSDLVIGINEIGRAFWRGDPRIFVDVSIVRHVSASPVLFLVWNGASGAPNHDRAVCMLGELPTVGRPDVIDDRQRRPPHRRVHRARRDRRRFHQLRASAHRRHLSRGHARSRCAQRFPRHASALPTRRMRQVFG